MTMTDMLALLGDQATLARRPAVFIERADDAATEGEYRELRRRVFVDEQALFERDDRDATDDDPRAITLVARLRDGTLAGGVRLAPADPGQPDIGWWRGSRLAVTPEHRRFSLTDNGVSIGPALIRAASAAAERAGALRFEATVQSASERMFTRLGWASVRPAIVAGAPHVLMRWPINRIADQAAFARATAGVVPEVAGPVPRGPVPESAGRPGYEIRVTADLGGGRRPGYTAWDVSMAGTVGLLAEASGCAAVLDVARVPRPASATMGDWLTRVPGFGLITTHAPGAPVPPPGPAASAVCGELTTGAGLRLRWPDGEETPVIDAGATGSLWKAATT
jgi:putative N-acetyltransferase (TIGR04045 family)